MCLPSIGYAPRPKEAYRNSTIHPSVSVPWCSCLGYRHAGCLQLSHRRSPEMCGLRMDVDPPRFLDQAAIGGGHIVSPPTGRYLVLNIFKYAKYGFCGCLSCCAGFREHSCRRCGCQVETKREEQVISKQENNKRSRAISSAGKQTPGMVCAGRNKTDYSTTTATNTTPV